MKIEIGSEQERRVLALFERQMPPELRQALDSPHCEEVSLNADGRLWVKNLGAAPEPIGQMNPVRAEGLMKVLANILDTPIAEDFPLLNGEVPVTGARFAGLLPPVVAAPVFSIRKRATMQLALADYVERDAMPPELAEHLRRAILERKNILVSGGTGSGKTTLTNALTGELATLCPADRIVILEDLSEIRCHSDNKVELRARESVSIADLLRITLRLRPDRIIIGEVRGAEALDLLRAWGTGHPGGICTLHADTATSALVQLEILVSMNDDAPSDERIGRLVAQNVDLVVHMSDSPNGRRITEVVEVHGFHLNEYKTSHIYGEPRE